jgi:glycosyltransferase involved in cell wall biosynthesis
MAKVAQVTSVHPPMDNRIFHNQCQSLAKAGFDLQYIAPKDPRFDPGSIPYIPTPDFNGRLSRLFLGNLFVFKQLLRMEKQLIHIHDPELFPMGFIAKCLGNKVVIDIHEDLPTQIMAKAYLPKWTRPVLSILAKALYKFVDLYADGIVAATPYIAKLFKNPHVSVVQNFPNIEAFTANSNPVPYNKRSIDLVYVGAITKERGIFEMLEVAEHIAKNRGLRFLIAGPCTDDLRAHIEKFKFVEYRNWLDRSEISQVLANAKIGFVLLHPIENYLVSQPTKMYEYMAVKTPFIASDFKFWTKDSRLRGAGLFVDPFDLNGVIEKTTHLLDNPKEAEELGIEGYHSALKNFSWSNESEELISFYNEILKTKVRVNSGSSTF